MSEFEILLQGDPIEWVAALPAYQSAPLQNLISGGKEYEEVAQIWLTAATQNTFRLGANTRVGDKNNFLKNVRIELRAFLCGDKRYKSEREKLFGEKSASRQFVVAALSVAIAPHINVATPVLAPIVAIALASMGKITLNAWCASQKE